MKIINGDSLEKLKDLEENSVDSVVTDPPYGLSFMGKKWDYDVPSAELWQEVMRVLKPGGHLLSFAGSRTYHRMAVNIEDAGFEIRDQIMWVYGSGFPKSHNIGKAVDKLQGNEREVVGEIRAGKTAMGQGSAWNAHENKTVMDDTRGNSPWEGWGTALKPAHEPIVVARKPLSEKTIAKNVLEWGTGGINIDGCRVSTSQSDIEKSQRATTKNNGVSFSLATPDKKGTAVAISSQGRFPANLIHDGSDEVVELFPDSGKGNRKGVYNYSGKEYNNKDTSMFNGDKPQAPSNFNDSGSAARFFYCAKASKKDRNEGLEEFEEKHTSANEFRPNHMEKALKGESGTAFGRFTPTKNNHPTVKPTKLMQYLVRLVTRKGGTVLDPFMGSGSTGKACKLEGMEFIGIELDPDYCKIAESRIKDITN